jgi:hypothetical protein
LGNGVIPLSYRFEVLMTTTLELSARGNASVKRLDQDVGECAWNSYGTLDWVLEMLRKRHYHVTCPLLRISHLSYDKWLVM